MNLEFSRVILWKKLLTKEAGIKGWYAQQYMAANHRAERRSKEQWLLDPSAWFHKQYS